MGTKQIIYPRSSLQSPFDDGMRNNNGKQKNIPKKKSLFLHYILWLFGGIFGIHHLYLNRDGHIFLLWCTFGGYLGFRWLSDMFMRAEYVHDGNEDPGFVRKFVPRRPPLFSTKRFVAQLMIGFMFGQIGSFAIPQKSVAGIDWTFLHWGVPLFVALGVWTVGNIGKECGAMWHCLVAAAITYPVGYLIYDQLYTLLITATLSTLAFDTFARQWTPNPQPRRSACLRSVKLSGAFCIYLAGWCCFLYFNATTLDENGAEVPIREVLQDFLGSPWWSDFKEAFRDTYNHAKRHGWELLMKTILESTTADAPDLHAYKVLGISPTSTKAEISAAYRKLSKKYHPDKLKGDEELHLAMNQFIEIQEAYEALRNRNKDDQ
ncbi:dnaJ homolog subfamily C member 22-like [Scaptodrosophila lebanonensis]|uniref:DnaJ homolog subfamily C member 22 n=1 Tax=Drosophila lebanonensis TaxID=7225 RepID=A0A6J2TY74_DROLE|nr:dnaJ homolog subfamily C member 22-like [Scaptodrosophila lebanonensis]